MLKRLVYSATMIMKNEIKAPDAIWHLGITNEFKRNQADLTLEDIKVIWMGRTVLLHKYGSDPKTLGPMLTSMVADSNIVQKIKRWCVKNSYRCSQIQNGKVML